METKADLFAQLILEARSQNIEAASDIAARIEASVSAHTSADQALLHWIKDRYALRTSHLDRADTSADLMRAPVQIAGSETGISLVTCAMNRTDNLIKSLTSWLQLEEISEIIIVDWNSDEPVLPNLNDAGLTDPRIRIVRVDHEPRWILSYAFNIGFRFARYNKILKADADIVLREDFFERNQLSGSNFISGFWEHASEGQEHINGFFYADTIHLGVIKGFNEFITTYGWDDDDIYERLSELGLNRQSVGPGTIHHLDHEDAQRFSLSTQAPESAWQELANDSLYKIRRNRFIARNMPKWDENREFAPFVILEQSGSYVRLQRDKDSMPHVVPLEIQKDADFYAALELISWQIGPQTYNLPRAAFTDLLTSKKRDQISKEDVEQALNDASAPHASPAAINAVRTGRKRIYVDAQHGLGNRLRAIASGAAIAVRTDRELVVVWQPDHHCECEMSDLFDYNGAVINQSFIDAAPSLDMDTYNYMESEGGEKDKPIQISSNDIYYRGAFVAKSDATDWDAENRFLKSLQPSLQVQDLIAPFDLSNHIAAHIRMEGGAGLDDHAYEQVSNWTEKDHELLHYWREKSNFKHFITRIDQIFAEQPDTKLFLATDMQQTYDIFEGYYGDRVTFLQREVYDRSREQIIYALADAILLSKCKRLMGSTWSSFSEMAMRLTDGYESIEMSGEDF